MKDKVKKYGSIFDKILDDKMAIRKCIQEGGDLKKLSKERNVRFVTPV